MSSLEVNKQLYLKCNYRRWPSAHARYNRCEGQRPSFLYHMNIQGDFIRIIKYAGHGYLTGSMKIIEAIGKWRASLTLGS